MEFKNVIAVGIGGMLGSVARYVTAYFIDQRMWAPLPSGYPYGTLTVNILGSFILGLVMGADSIRIDSGPPPWKLFLTAGFCGGFTTFSAFALENVALSQQRTIVTSALYIGASLVLGIAAVAGGLALGKLIRNH